MSAGVALTGDEVVLLGRRLIGAAEHRQRVAESEQTLERLQAERDQLDSAIAGHEERYEQRKMAAARAGAMESGLRRSKMSAAEKAQFIAEHGSGEYFRIPWA